MTTNKKIKIIGSSEMNFMIQIKSIFWELERYMEGF